MTDSPAMIAAIQLVGARNGATSLRDSSGAGSHHTLQAANKLANAMPVGDEIVKGFERALAATERNAGVTLNAPVVPANTKGAEAQLLTLLIQNFVSEFLPEQSDQLYGSGTAGRAWRSQFSQALAEVFVESGTFNDILNKTSRASGVGSQGTHHPKNKHEN